MEIASTLNAMGKSVTVLDREPPLVRLVGESVASRVEEVAQSAGVRFHVDPGGASLFGEPGARPRGARTASGRVFEADLVVSAVGDVPNVEWLAGSGLDVMGGVKVDSRSRVRDDIVAAGDVARRTTTDGGTERIPTWTNAVDQARAAARALLRGDEAATYEPSCYAWTEQFGLDIKVSGRSASDTDLIAEPEWWCAEGGALLRWGPEGTARRVLSWNHPVRPAQLKRMTRSPAPLTRTRS